eukprot:m.452257 g.452257  ORF g.452257 m.452257 type:complete len:389 (+) comp20298_c0_seq1:1069-2235(+)
MHAVAEGAGQTSRRDFRLIIGLHETLGPHSMSGAAVHAGESKGIEASVLEHTERRRPQPPQQVRQLVLVPSVRLKQCWVGRHKLCQPHALDVLVVGVVYFVHRFDERGDAELPDDLGDPCPPEGGVLCLPLGPPNIDRKRPLSSKLLHNLCDVEIVVDEPCVLWLEEHLPRDAHNHSLLHVRVQRALLDIAFEPCTDCILSCLDNVLLRYCVAQVLVKGKVEVETLDVRTPRDHEAERLVHLSNGVLRRRGHLVLPPSLPPCVFLFGLLPLQEAPRIKVSVGGGIRGLGLGAASADPGGEGVVRFEERPHRSELRQLLWEREGEPPLAALGLGDGVCVVWEHPEDLLGCLHLPQRKEPPHRCVGLPDRLRAVGSVEGQPFERLDLALV